MRFWLRTLKEKPRQEKPVEAGQSIGGLYCSVSSGITDTLSLFQTRKPMRRLAPPHPPRARRGTPLCSVKIEPCSVAQAGDRVRVPTSLTQQPACGLVETCVDSASRTECICARTSVRDRSLDSLDECRPHQDHDRR